MSKLNHKVWCLSICYFLIVAASSMPVVMAETAVPYKISMERDQPNSPLRKSTIMAHVKKEFPGRVLSIFPDTDNGPDCHIVKLMGEDGEFRIIHVACD